MRAYWTLFGMLLAAIPGAPALAQDTTPMTAMVAGEVIAVMPDGKMARTMVSDARKVDAMKKTARRIPWCMMFMLGADGSVYMIDTSAHGPMVECEEMVE